MAAKFFNLKSAGTKKNKLIIGGLVLALFALGTIYFSFRTVQNLTTRAEQQSIQIEGPVAVETAPEGIKVKWNTSEPKSAVILYGTDKADLSQQVYSLGTGTENSVLLNNIDPERTYYFKIQIEGKEFDNNGEPWEIPADTLVSEEVEPTETPEEEITPEPTEESPTVTVIPTPTEILQPGDVTPTPLPAITSTPTLSCDGNNCATIWSNRTKGCTMTDYLKCVANNPSSIISSLSSTITNTLAPTSASATATAAAYDTNNCRIDYLQANSCTDWEWDNFDNKIKACGDKYTRYFFQCRSTDWTSTDTAVWYCNEIVDDNNSDVPCAGAPTPAPGQAVFCRVRAETAEGGDANATPWVTAKTTCPKTTADNSTCDIGYIQANTCKSFIWDLINGKDPACKNSFNNYFFQCKSTSFASSTGFWYCNTTTADHYKDLPCYNASVPADGASIYCRVRAEDAYSTTDHSTDWVESTVEVCPTSTPTPTNTPTSTPTSTPTPTRTPTPAP